MQTNNIVLEKPKGILQKSSRQPSIQATDTLCFKHKSTQLLILKLKEPKTILNLRVDKSGEEQQC